MKSSKDFETDQEYRSYLRTYFAAKALGVCVILASSGKINSESTAMEAVKLADALIEALNK